MSARWSRPIRPASTSSVSAPVAVTARRSGRRQPRGAAGLLRAVQRHRRLRAVGRDRLCCRASRMTSSSASYVAPDDAPPATPHPTPRLIARSSAERVIRHGLRANRSRLSVERTMSRILFVCAASMTLALTRRRWPNRLRRGIRTAARRGAAATPATPPVPEPPAKPAQPLPPVVVNPTAAADQPARRHRQPSTGSATQPSVVRRVRRRALSGRGRAGVPACPTPA